MSHAPLPRFAFTTRLAFKEASNVAELLLIREPERRFYRECRLAGFDVAVYDESSSERIREQAAKTKERTRSSFYLQRIDVPSRSLFEQIVFMKVRRS